MIDRTKLESSGVPVRSASFLSAVCRVSPILISLRVSANSSASGPCHVLGQLRDGAVEAEAGLDADRHQVERVRKLGADRVLALARLRRDHEVGSDEADPAQRERAEQHAARASHGAAEDCAEERSADCEARLERQERRRGDLPTEAAASSLALTPSVVVFGWSFSVNPASRSPIGTSTRWLNGSCRWPSSALTLP
jgi:hypothetical protein